MQIVCVLCNLYVQIVKLSTIAELNFNYNHSRFLNTLNLLRIKQFTCCTFKEV